VARASRQSLRTIHHSPLPPSLPPSLLPLSQNFYSYFLVDEFLWIALERFVNRFRLSLGLERIRRGESGSRLLYDNQVGREGGRKGGRKGVLVYSALCMYPCLICSSYHSSPCVPLTHSPTLPPSIPPSPAGPFHQDVEPLACAQPRDWGEHIDVVGYFFEEEDEDEDRAEEGREEGVSKHTFPPSTEGLPPALRDWLYPPTSSSSSAPSLPPLFVGFGSMIIEDTSRLTDLITRASAAAGIRVILQSFLVQDGGREGGRGEA